jgi:tetratricopeptide (TPR) repeat protein
VEAIAGVGYIARRRRQWAEAVDAEQKVSTLDPRNGSALTDLGVTYLATRQFAKAEEVLHRALIADPTSDGATAYLLGSVVFGRGDTAAGRAILAALPPGISAKVRENATAMLARFARQYELSNQSVDRMPEEVLSDRPGALINRALNDLAAGLGDRARRRADSSIQVAASLLARPAQADVFGNRATLLTLQGVAEAIQGRSADAVRDGERAVQLSAPSRDAMDGPRSVDGLIMIHAILGHRDEAIRLITQQAHEAFQVVAGLPTTRATIQLDPLFDGIRSDPRIQALLKDDAAWVVK